MARQSPKKQRGRPPIRGASATFTTRITPETKAALKAAAAAKNTTESRIAESILQEALAQPNGLKDRAFGEPHVKALAVALARVAIEVEAQTGKRWNEDPFTFDTLAHVISQVVQRFAPKGKCRVPAAVRKLARGKLAPAEWREPAGLAFAIASRFLIRLTTMRPITAATGEERLFRERIGRPFSDDDLILRHVQRDLGLEAPRLWRVQAKAEPAASKRQKAEVRDAPADRPARRQQLEVARAAAKARKEQP